MAEPTKKDFAQARDAWAARVINIEAELIAARAGFGFCSDKFDEMPDEDPMPKEVKEVLEAAK